MITSNWKVPKYFKNKRWSFQSSWLWNNLSLTREKKLKIKMYALASNKKVNNNDKVWMRS